MAQHHEHGSMDTSEHEKTFAGFVTFATRTAILVIVVLVFMALVNA